MREFGRYALTGFATAGVSRALLLVMHVLLGRELGPTSYGAFALTYGLVLLIGQLGTLGWHQTIPRFIAECESTRNWAQLRGLLIRAEQVSLCTSGLVGIVLIAASYLFSPPPLVATSLVVAGLSGPLFALKRLRGRQLATLGRIKLGMALEEGAIPTATIAYLLFSGDVIAERVIVVFVSLALPVVILMTLIAYGLLSPEAKIASADYQTRKWMRVTFPTFIGQVFSLSMARVDVLLVAPLAGIASVGLFSGAYRIAYAIQFIPEVLGAITAPMFARAFYSQENLRLKRLFLLSTGLSVVVALPIVTILVVASGSVVELTYGGQFSASQPLLVVLCLGQFVNAITGPVAAILIATGRERYFGGSNAFVAVLGIAGNLVMIPIYGAIGAAIVTALAMAILNSVQFWYAFKVIHSLAVAETTD